MDTIPDIPETEEQSVIPSVNTPSIKVNIDKPVDTTISSPINAPSGDKIDQDAALEYRNTKFPFNR